VDQMNENEANITKSKIMQYNKKVKAIHLKKKYCETSREKLRKLSSASRNEFQEEIKKYKLDESSGFEFIEDLSKVASSSLVNIKRNMRNGLSKTQSHL
jgi:hypothetical protein